MIQRAVSVLGLGVGTLVCLAAVGCVIALSVFMNGYFFFIRLGGNPRDLTLATVEVAALAGALVTASIDVLKAFAPVFCARAFAHRNYPYVAVSVILLIGGMTLSMIAAYGLIIEQRSGEKTERLAAQETVASLTAQAADAEARIATLGYTRPVATIEAELAAEEQNVRWSASQGCTDATVTRSREFCAAYQIRKAELGKAEALVTERARHAELLQKLEAIRERGGAKATDPQLDGLAAITGWSVAKLETGVLLLVAIMIEFVSAFGLYLVFGHGPKEPPQRGARATPPMTLAPATLAPPAPVMAIAPPEIEERPPAAPPPKNVEREAELGEYGLRRLEHVPGAVVALTDLHADYRRWRATDNRTAMSLRTFTETLTQLAATVDGIELGTRGRKRVLLNMALRRQATNDDAPTDARDRHPPTGGSADRADARPTSALPGAQHREPDPALHREGDAA